MGGLGSGRYWHSSSKDTVNSYHSIDIRRWRREGLLTPGNTFSTKLLRNGELTGSIQIFSSAACVILSYRYKQSGQWIAANYPIDIEWTNCNLGGRRPWFRCPAGHCGRRSAILYGGAMFACRRCHQLAYPSQRENIGDRSTRKADKIRDRMGWESGILNGEGLKPKGMHWKTYERLCTLHNDLVYFSLREATARFGINMFDFY